MGAINKTQLFSDVDAVSAVQSGTWNIDTVTTLTGITNVVHIDDNAGSLTVDGTVAATQSGTWDIGTVGTITNVVHIDDNSGSLTVDASDLDIRNLAYASDSVTAHQGGTWSNQITDGTDVLAINNDGSINVQGTLNVSFAASGAIAQAAVSVLTTATALPTLANKKFMLISNEGSHDCWIGGSAVTIGTGAKLPKGGNVLLESASAWYAICDTAKLTTIRVVENA